MSAIKWTQKTDTYWEAEACGHRVSVKHWQHLASKTWHWLVVFNIDDETSWNTGTVNDLAEAKAAAEQMARRWAGKGEG
jgi:hypothetical protein